jgi:hypothetical protein
MSKARKSPRTHSRRELAPAAAPIGVGVVTILTAVALFAGISALIN